MPYTPIPKMPHGGTPDTNALRAKLNEVIHRLNDVAKELDQQAGRL